MCTYVYCLFTYTCPKWIKYTRYINLLQIIDYSIYLKIRLWLDSLSKKFTSQCRIIFRKHMGVGRNLCQCGVHPKETDASCLPAWWCHQRFQSLWLECSWSSPQWLVIYCWLTYSLTVDTRILFILIKTIAVCFKFRQTIVLLSNIKFIEFLHDLMIVWYRYFGFEMDFHVKPPCKWHYPIMVSFQGDFINSCTESCEILELGSQGATPRQVILSIMLMHTFKLYDSITYFWV